MLLVFLVLLLVVGVMGRLLRRMRHTQAALQMSESRYRRIVETAHEGIWVIDADESTVFVNRRMCEILGYSEPEMLGRNVLDFMDEEARGLARERITRRRQGESGQYEARWRARDGRAVWTRMAINPLWDEQGEYLGVLAMISDITEQHHARKALEESKSRFRQLTESIREVVWLGSPDWNEVVYI
ncbi:MAG: PAS domain S-box protein, partial [Chromatiales bacterium]|nr:PAS domain S-box protein [Chromatiales bacterium]